MDETWLPIPEWIGYEASDQGKIRSTSRFSRYGPEPHILSPRVAGYGYPIVTLFRDGKRTTKAVHVLIALTFLGPRPDGQETRHLNDNKLDCRLVNLRYGTPSENQQDTVRNGNHWNTRKTHCPAGHEYTPENTYQWASSPNRRRCRKCKIKKKREKRTLARLTPLLL
jgi:hypothetical protein